jgi:hypothetical protein
MRLLASRAHGQLNDRHKDGNGGDEEEDADGTHPPWVVCPDSGQDDALEHAWVRALSEIRRHPSMDEPDCGVWRDDRDDSLGAVRARRMRGRRMVRRVIDRVLAASAMTRSAPRCAGEQCNV